MGSKMARTVVIWISVLVMFVGAAFLLYFRLKHIQLPLWDKVAITYGGVFCVFLFFDEIGRQATKNRKDSDVKRNRPRPQVSSTPGQQVPTAQTRISSGQLRLERVKPNHAHDLKEMIDEAVTEVMALQASLPELDGEGHVIASDFELWMNDAHYYPFYIMYHDTCIGCCVLHTVHPAHEIELFYIQSSMRRRRGGTTALHKLIEFAGLVGTHTEINCEVGTNNMRAQRFFLANGFHVVTDADVALGNRLLSRVLREA